MRAAGGSCSGTVYAPNPTPLIFDCRLWRASQLHSQDMSDNGYFSHTSLDGKRFWERSALQGIASNAENIARGSSTADGVLSLWAGSTGHCNNMMNPAYTMMGVGHAMPGNYWTQMFKGSEVPVDNSCYPPADAPSLLEATGDRDETDDLLRDGGLKMEPEVLGDGEVLDGDRLS